MKRIFRNDLVAVQKFGSIMAKFVATKSRRNRTENIHFLWAEQWRVCAPMETEMVSGSSSCRFCTKQDENKNSYVKHTQAHTHT